MNRRSFLRSLVAAPFVAIAAPVLGRPSTPIPVLPITTIDCTQAFGMDYEWSDTLAPSVAPSVSAFDHEYTQPFRIGDVVRVRMPQRYTLEYKPS